MALNNKIHPTEEYVRTHVSEIPMILGIDKMLKAGVKQISWNPFKVNDRRNTINYS